MGRTSSYKLFYGQFKFSQTYFLASFILIVGVVLHVITRVVEFLHYSTTKRTGKALILANAFVIGVYSCLTPICINI